ncbi:hypothetical protein F2Q69_00050472 [Brassica cretica]|uniref:Glycosyl transferase family 1 domain-containing protein n=1 Tax=Brassica cretica TaxID=69181 RepID=A0A8S9PMW2_BRACR|nr:hypothetical protein F2Q69_00050472 [Brassica cretica]
MVYLLVAGSGPWGKRYAELGEHVRVLGSLEPEELSGFYNALDVFVNPTLRPQALDLTIIEAMQCGKPVVAPNYPSIVGTVVVDERFGYTFSPNVRSLVETLDSVVRDGSRVLEMKGKACKDYALSIYSDGCVWTFGDKGHPFLYEAFALIAKTHPQVYLLVAGSGPWGKRYAELGEHVRVLGSLEPEELSGFYNALDVFVNPTLRPQALDLTIIEAMQCGKPVVAPNYPSIVGTVVVDERFGYTFSPNVRSLVETLDSVVRDGSRVLEMKGKACKDYALSMFTATQMASAYERFFMCMTNERFCRYPLPVDS